MKWTWKQVVRRGTVIEQVLAVCTAAAADLMVILYGGQSVRRPDILSPLVCRFARQR